MALSAYAGREGKDGFSVVVVAWSLSPLVERGDASRHSVLTAVPPGVERPRDYAGVLA